MLNLLINTADPNQNGLLNDFLSQGAGIEQSFVRGDRSLELLHRPVVPNPNQSASGLPWLDDFQTGDTFQVAISNPDTPPTGGTFKLGVQRSGTKTINSASAANPSVVSCTNHGMATGDIAIWSGMSGSTPDLNSQYFQVTVIDADTFSIPENVTVGGTGGTLISYNTSGLSSLAYNITSAALQTALSTTTVAEGYSAVGVSLFEPGNYEFQFSSAGLVPTLYSSGSGLAPASSALVSQVIAGDSSTNAIQVLELSQLPVAYSEPSTLLPAPGITANIAQAGNASPKQNKIYSLVMTSGTYGGTFALNLTTIAGVVTSFIIQSTIGASDLQTILNTSGGITSGDIAVTKTSDTFNVQFQGTQAASNSPVITVTNIDLLSPEGVTGKIDLNTINLFLAFAQTTSPTLNFTLAIRRQRTTGEDVEYFQQTVTLKRSIINVSTMVPLTLPQFYTAAQCDARFARIDASGNVLVGNSFRLVAITNGAKIQTSGDGGSTWNDGPSFAS